MRFQAHLPFAFWGECILTATYILNCIPTLLLQNRSPFECLFNAIPNSHFGIFGCLCYATTLSHNRHKFDPLFRQCIFLGYPFGVKTYKLYDLHSHSIFYSQDVVFYEIIFPYQSDLPYANIPSHSTISLPIATPIPPHKDLPPSVPSPSSSTDLAIYLPHSSVSPTSSHTHHSFSPPNHISPSSFPFPSYLLPITSSPLPRTSSPIPSDLASSPLLPPSQTPAYNPHRSSRIRHPPSYLKEYHCNLLSSHISLPDLPLQPGKQHSISHVLCYKEFSPFIDISFSLFLLSQNQSLLLKLLKILNGVMLCKLN